MTHVRQPWLNAPLLIRAFAFRPSTMSRPAATAVLSAAFLCGVMDTGAAQAPADSAPHAPAIARLPAARGPHAVGTMRFVWTDSSRVDPTAPTAGELRELIVQLWYPAVHQRAPRSAPYMMELAALRAGLEKDPDLARYTATYELIATGAELSAPMAPSAHPAPVVLFSHGLGAPRALYTTFLMTLASQGYVVAAIDHPGMGLVALPDGRLAEPVAPLGHSAPPEVRTRSELERHEYWLPEITYISADQRFVLDRLVRLDRANAPGPFAGRFDLSRVAMIGHSRGFVGLTCAADIRVKACINIEGDPDYPERHVGLPQPFLTLRNARDTFPVMTSIFKVARAPTYDVLVRDANHNSVTDLGLFGFQGQDFAGALRRLNTISTYVVAFLDQSLRGRRSPLLARPTGSDPDVVLTRYGPIP